MLVMVFLRLAAGLQRFAESGRAHCNALQTNQECNRNLVLGHLMIHFESLDGTLGILICSFAYVFLVFKQSVGSLRMDASDSRLQSQYRFGSLDDSL